MRKKHQKIHKKSSEILEETPFIQERRSTRQTIKKVFLLFLKYFFFFPYAWAVFLLLWLLGLTFAPQIMKGYIPQNLHETFVVSLPVQLTGVFFALLMIKIGIRLFDIIHNRPRIRWIKVLVTLVIFFLIFVAIYHLNFWIGYGSVGGYSKK